jgi:poly-beta-1,6-N-acetyl-D-glucosamine synthase
MTKKISVSVGIPAYNEEQNIKQLLTALLRQKQEGFVLREIVVVSDGSTDGTEEQVRLVSDPRIRLISLSENTGLALAQNKILDTVTGDVLVLLDADIIPGNQNLLREIIKPFQINAQLGMIGADTVSAYSGSWFESVIEFSHDFKQRIYKRINSGDTIYLCHGRARAFVRAFYSELRWPAVNAEDAYSYLTCKQAGFQFEFAPLACVVFRSPGTFFDYAKQSHRFHLGKVRLSQLFPSRLVKNSFYIPIRAWLSVLVWACLRHPLLITNYILIVVVTRFYKQWMRPVKHGTYEISKSSKIVVRS